MILQNAFSRLKISLPNKHLMSNLRDCIYVPTEEQQLAEEQMVLMNKFQDLTRRAIAEINADGRYKMILNAVSVVDADPTLNISDLVLKKVDELYAADSADAE